MCAALFAAICLLACAWAPARSFAAEAEYQIYPTPHNVSYGDGSQTLRSQASVLVEDGIDAETRARLDEALALKGITASDVDEVPSARGVTSVLVGVKGSGGAVDAQVEKLVDAGVLSYDEGLFDQTDSYLLASVPSDGTGPDQVIVLGRDTDAAFYGLTTLYQILQQASGASLRAFTVSDYADVITRGFIEGYYGNPWSTTDRINLMTWGGYYKLNAYVYAPKDDPKHNAQWRELYTEEELEQKIAPLAEAGNASKCRFLFALHPFMSNPITSGNYDESVEVLKTKFLQVMDHGVRQIAILADDAADQGSSLYTRLLEDMTDWIHEQQKATKEDGSLKYPGLKDTIIFCPVAYYGQGEAWYADLPDNVQVVNTGGQVWGKVSDAFVTRFQNNSGGTSPFMWVNWPCSDNDKDALHMGGHNNFLGSDVQPGDVEGVVLNPMQQSEPSKQGIFMNADFSWNLWTSTAHADQAWEDSFSYIDHNSPVDTAGSEALRELSRHMLRMYGGGVTWENGESSAIKDDLASFRQKLDAGSVTVEDIASMRSLFEDLASSAATYRANAGNPAMAEQIVYWIDTWDDLTAAALADLDALEADLTGDTSGLLSHHAEATTKLDAANNHGFHYVDHTEYARVGKAYLTPTVNALADYVSERAALVSDPNAVITKFVTNRTDTPTGDTASVFDGDTSTGVIYKSPNSLAAGTYFGVTKSRAFDLDSVRFTQGNGKDFMSRSKLQYFDGEEWHDIEGTGEFTERVVEAEDLGLTGIYGVRLVAVADRADTWPTIFEIELNCASDQESGVYTGTVSMEKQVLAGNALQNASDADDATEAWFMKSATGDDKDTTQAGAAVIVTFDEIKTINSIVFKQGISKAGDVIDAGTVSWQDAEGAWHEAGSVDSSTSQTIELPAPVQAKAIKVVNDQDKAIWWRVADLYAVQGEGPAAEASVSLGGGLTQYQGYGPAYVIDGNDATGLWASHNSSNIEANDNVALNYTAPVTVGSVRIVQGNKPNGSGVGDILPKAVLEVTADGKTWEHVADLSQASVQTITFFNREVVGIRVRATENTDGWWVLNEITAKKGQDSTEGNVITSIEGVDLTASGENGTVTLSDGTVKFSSGDYLAVDLGGIRSGVRIDKGSTELPEGAQLVHSMNALEWLAYEGEPVDARYVGVKASGDAEVAFKGFAASYTVKSSPSYVDGDLGTFDAGAIFDGDITTTFKNTQGPSEGSTVVFDLGQERTITSLAYYVPESSKDFIRNAVVEVADAADAPDDAWTKVLQINGDDPVENEYNEDTAKSATWLTHDTVNPGNMFTANPKTSASEGNEADPNGTEPLNVTGRYLRIRFTATYSYRWVEIGELVINGGEYVSPYGDAEVVSSSIEVPGMSPANLFDGDTTTVWQPAEDKGTMSYRVSSPLRADGSPIEGVRIVSNGTPSKARVSATVYTDDTYQATETIELGTLNQPLAEFTFARIAAQRGLSFAAVKSIDVAWDGTAPRISEIFLLDTATPADPTTLQALVDELSGTDTSGWTASSAATFADALATAKAALAGSNASQSYLDSVQKALQSAFDGAVERYTGTELAELVADHVSNDDGSYEASSYDAYQVAYAAASAALEDAANLSQADGEALAAELKAARDNLVFDQTAADRAKQAIADAEAIYGSGEYTTASRESFDAALQALRDLVKEGTAEPSAYASAMDALVAAEQGLVDVSELLAARAEFEATSPEGYTSESFAAYRAAYEASETVLEQGTAEDVAAAIEALRASQAALVALDLDAIIEDAEKLSEDDYTAASWSVFEQALDAARAEHDPSLDQELGQAIIDARAQLVNVVALKAAIARAEAVDDSAYTEDSVAALDAAVEAAQGVLEDGTVDEVEAARLAIVAALEGLVPNGGTPGGDGGDGGKPDGGTPGDGSGNGGDGSGAKPGTGGSLPTTGDASLAVALASATGAAVACAAGCISSRRRR